MTDAAKTMYLPDTMSQWPWKRVINPHYEEVKVQSSAWLQSFGAFNARSQYACEKCDCSLLASLVWPWASKEHLRTGCDVMHVFFVIDEYIDAEDGDGARGIVDVVLDAINNPSKARPEDEIVVGEIVRQFWELAIKTASLTSQRRFVESFAAYLNSNIEQALDRENDILHTVDSYFSMRRDNVASWPSLALIELGLDLPDNVIYHPLIVDLGLCITDLIIIDNDLVSYNKEQATGNDRHNLLTIVMRESNVDLDEAIRRAADRHADIATRFIEGTKTVPAWGGETDQQVAQYVQGLGQWLRGHDCWNFEGWRYLGSKGVEIQKTRCVPLLPRKLPTEQDTTLRRENVVVPVIEDLEGDSQATQPKSVRVPGLD